MLKRLVYKVLRWLLPDFFGRYETGKFAETHVAPLLSCENDWEPHREGEALLCPGISFDAEQQTAYLERLSPYRDLFPLIRADPRINPLHHDRADRIRNGYYPTPDAETYAAIVAYHRPGRIIEIGGGFSTLIARAVIDRLRLKTELVVIDPAPRTEVRHAADRLVRALVEQCSSTDLALPDSGILFIDSSHVLRAGGDVAFLYGELLPALPAGVLVHVHDVFLPFDYSPFAAGAWWTEQYVLKALLSHSPRYRIELALRWLARTNPALLTSIFGPAVAENPAHGGGSIWFRITDNR